MSVPAPTVAATVDGWSASGAFNGFAYTAGVTLCPARVAAVLPACPLVRVTAACVSRAAFTGRPVVTSWTVTADAASAVQACQVLYEAGRLLPGCLPLSDSGPRWFQLIDGQLADPCIHPGALPVRDCYGETVAWLCPRCDQQLPASWGDRVPR